MQIEPLMTKIEAAVSTQLAVAGADPAMEAAAAHLVSALRPALGQAALELAEQAAAEVSGQLPDRTVEVILSDGEPTLRVVESGAGEDPGPDEEFDARITLRLPPSLKGLVEEAAGSSGDSVNQWVVRALASKAGRTRRSGRRVTGRYEL